MTTVYSWLFPVGEKRNLLHISRVMLLESTLTFLAAAAISATVTKIISLISESAEEDPENCEKALTAVYVFVFAYLGGKWIAFYSATDDCLNATLGKFSYFNPHSISETPTTTQPPSSSSSSSHVAPSAQPSPPEPSLLRAVSLWLPHPLSHNYIRFLAAENSGFAWKDLLVVIVLNDMANHESLGNCFLVLLGFAVFIVLGVTLSSWWRMNRWSMSVEKNERVLDFESDTFALPLAYTLTYLLYYSLSLVSIQSEGEEEEDQKRGLLSYGFDYCAVTIVAASLINIVLPCSEEKEGESLEEQAQEVMVVEQEHMIRESIATVEVSVPSPLQQQLVQSHGHSNQDDASQEMLNTIDAIAARSTSPAIAEAVLESGGAGGGSGDVEGEGEGFNSHASASSWDLSTSSLKELWVRFIGYFVGVGIFQYTQAEFEFTLSAVEGVDQKLVHFGFSIVFAVLLSFFVPRFYATGLVNTQAAADKEAAKRAVAGSAATPNSTRPFMLSEWCGERLQQFTIERRKLLLLSCQLIIGWTWEEVILGLFSILVTDPVASCVVDVIVTCIIILIACRVQRFYDDTKAARQKLVAELIKQTVQHRKKTRRGTGVGGLVNKLGEKSRETDKNSFELDQSSSQMAKDKV